MEIFVIILTAVLFLSGIVVLFKLNQNHDRIVNNLSSAYKFIGYKELPGSIERQNKKISLNLNSYITNQKQILSKSIDMLLQASLSLKKSKPIENEKSASDLENEVLEMLQEINQVLNSAKKITSDFSEILLGNFHVEMNENSADDETEEQKRRAAERLHKLRNLSFNVNAADPNNDFETVPAYIRRNMELYNSNIQVENFYSSYEVKTDQNNQTQISTINTFLEGNKAD